MSIRPKLAGFVAVFALAGLTACAQNFGSNLAGVSMSPSATNTSEDGQPQPLQPSFAQFQDIPIPGGAKMNMDRTLVLGAHEAWIGRLVIDSSVSQAQMFDFFKQRTGEFGWREITSVRSATSVLTYSRDQRIMTIQILTRPLLGTQVDITMSPSGNNQSPVTNAVAPGSAALQPVQTIR